MELGHLTRLIEKELETDRVSDDVTGRLLGEAGQTPAEAIVFAKESGVFSGLAVLQAFPAGALEVEALVEEGDSLELGRPVARIRGTVADCLASERTILNFLSQTCGVATLTRLYVDAVRPHRAKILATRKTLPGLRELQLLAVRAGGGFVHRRSLSDGILIKDNHLVFLPEAEAVARARASKSPLHRVEVEVQSLEQLDRLLENPPDIIMLDNFSLGEIEVALDRIDGRCEVEISGGVTLETVGAYAATGVDYISVGRLTHSAPALDLSLDIRAEAK